MSTGLTYPSLKCVLEYLEANKRIHIASRCLSIRKFEKSIPIHLDELWIQNYYIRLNNISLTFDKESADFFFENKEIYDDDSEEASWNILATLVDSRDFKIRRGRLPKGMKFYTSARRAISVFLGRRQKIYVHKLNFNVFGYQVSEIFSSSKLKIRELKPQSGNYAFEALKFIDASSFPLKSLWLEYPRIEVLSHEMAKSAENLTINCSIGIQLDSYKDCFQNLSNKNLFVQKFISGGPEEVVKLVHNWIEKPRSFGTICRIGTYSDWRMDSFVEAIKKRTKTHCAKLIEPDTRLPGKFLVIPINTMSEIHIFAINTTFLGVTHHILMKMMPEGSSAPCAPDISMRPSRNNQEELSDFQLLAIVIWLIFGLTFLLILWHLD